MLNLAIIGCGVIAQYHLRALAKLTTARAAAVCDLRSDVAQKTAADFNVPRWTTSADELLADPSIDAVILALPTCARTPLAIEAFRRGKHVLTEKPVAMNAADVRAMLAAQGDRVGACCSSRYRSFESTRVARDFIRTGALGALRTISCRAVNPAGKPPTGIPPVWRLRRDLNGGGLFVNWGCYDLDYLLGLLDFKLTPRHVLARTWQVGAPFAAYAAPGSDGETHVNALITFAEGCVLDYERAESSTLPPDNHWQIAGELGTLTLQMIRHPDAKILFTEADATNGTRTRVIWEGDESKAGAEHDGPVIDFVDAILEKRAPRTSLQDALLFARLADGIYASADRNEPVAFD
ncbi:Gfo/Idh/MocA family oxidoreductase [Horticoccus luteus]|uniref:Gfo/Idh/MocA family oxidoreductase n=1 Tax=Horticoccus luteus TaxID=2862869 RepID=A0A8F9TV21_9BACT|nr:Gfo/Idh/MocA family oxidoreductase [Horticoccus luteus]QYM78303.1 Gfo/Idh/MocA family oxidoreductase [Horticoccus luteus]